MTLAEHFDKDTQKEVIEWLVPTSYAMFGFYIQSVCLHWATYCYVHKYGVNATIAPAKNPYAVLDDPVADVFERKNINLQYIDMAAGFIPMLFFGLTMFELVKLSSVWGSFYLPQKRKSMRKNLLHLWTKVMLCAGFLFTIKGIIGAVTTVPDSSGWEVCKARLKPEGMAYMKEEHSFMEMLVVDFGWNVLWYHHPLRYCSDMMYSGHTFVVTLFALGLYEFIRISRPNQSKKTLGDKDLRGCLRKHANTLKMVCLSAVAAFAIGEQCVEIYAVEKSRFHYTSDIVVALVLTFLFYTNGVIAISAKKWSQEGLDILLRDPWIWMEDKDTESGKLWNEALDNVQENKTYADLKPESTFPQEWQSLHSRGDIFIPPCCFPCCCLSGREHIYSDGHIKNIIDAFVIKDEGADDKTKKDNKKKRREMVECLKQDMNFSEGVSWHNFMTFVRKIQPTTVDPAHEGYSRAPP